MQQDWPVTPAQRKVIEFRDGLAAVSATAGSGKTRTVIYAALDHLAEGAKGSQILLVAYNKAAATEMADRISLWAPTALRSEARNVVVTTFHAYCRQVLIEARRDVDVLSDSTARRIVGDILRHDYGDWESDPAEYLSRISYLREVVPGASPDTWIECQITDRQTAAIAKAYFRQMRDAGKIDFTEMQAGAMHVLDERLDIRERINHRFILGIVDEAQDQNPLRAAIWARIHGLTYGPQTTRTVMLVGDPCQSIYRFIGATPEIFLAYRKNCTDLRLGENFRSVPEIIGAGNAILGDVVGTAAGPAAGPAPGPTAYPIRTSFFESGETEAAWVTAEIRRLTTNGGPNGAAVRAGEIAVIYRTRGAGAAIQIAMFRAGIPHVVRGGSGFFGSAAVRDTLAYLDAAVRWTPDAIARAAGRPARFLGKAWREDLMANAARGVSGRDLVDPARYESRAARGVAALRTDLDRVARDLDRAGPAGAVRSVFESTGLKGRSFAESCPEADQDAQMDLINALVEMSDNFGSADELLDAAEGAQRAEQEDRTARQSHVVLTTAHRAKGLEWDHVFLIGLSQNIWPHWLALRDGQEDEERRIAFVAVTRARKTLTVSTRQEYCGHAVDPSVYLPAIAAGIPLPPITWRNVDPWARWIQEGCPRGGAPLPDRTIGEM